MKILYLILPLWILVALFSFFLNSIPEAKNQFHTYKQQENKSPEEEQEHRGGTRRYTKVNKS